MSIDFFHKEMVYALILLPLAAISLFFYRRWKKRALQRMGEAGLIDQLIQGYSKRNDAIKWTILLIALLAGIVALWDIRTPDKESSLNRKGIDIVIALDVSNSMLATDVAPSRLDKAKQFINKLMQQHPNDRFGLIVFAAQAYLQVPLTADHAAASLFVSTAHPDQITRQGTILSNALDRSATTFGSNDKSYKAVILITDGEDHEEQALDTAKSLTKQGIMISTVGIGSLNGSFLEDPATGQPKTDENGNMIISRLNEGLLQEIASITNGVYVHLENTETAISTIKQQLSQIESKAYNDQSLMNYRLFYSWPAGIMLGFIAIATFIPNTRKKSRYA